VSESRSWVDVDLGAVAHNVRVLRRTVEPAGVLAVVKADGYGHGAVPVAGAAIDAGAVALGVAIVAEGVELRDAGIESRVLVLSEPRADELAECVAFGLEPAVYTTDGVAAVAKAAADHGRVTTVHVKVDTGMHRVGAPPDEALAVAEAVVGEPSLALGSIWTHCAVADEPDNPFTAQQLARYDGVLAAASARGIEVPWRHAANSAAALCHPAARYDVVRVGIALYGIAPAPALAGIADLRPALAWKARVSFVKTVPAGDGISYGLRHRFERDTVVATVPVGYADGVARRWSSHDAGGEVVVGGERRPVVGVVTMDQLMVDCGDVPVRAGDVVELIGPDLTADEWAERLGTIAYEIVCGIGPRVPRRYIT
jgi:alanine racemase